MALWNTIPSSSTILQTAVNRPFKKDGVDTKGLGTSDGRRNATLSRLVFLEARVQDNQMENSPHGYTVSSFDLAALLRGGKTLVDNAVQTQGLMFNVNPDKITMTYQKDCNVTEISDSNLRDVQTWAPLSRGIQFYGNKTTVMQINGHTGVPEKDSMIMTLTTLASLGAKWWTVDSNKTSGTLDKATSLLSSRVLTPDSAFPLPFKRIHNLPIRWRIIYYTCDTLSPFTESDLINKDMKDRPANDPKKSMQGEGKTRKELARFYLGRVVKINFFHSANTSEESQNEIRYEMTVNIDQFDDNTAISESNKAANTLTLGRIGKIGSDYITGL